MSDRVEQFQESVNRKVLIEWVRVLGLRNPHKRTYDKVLADFSENILKYPKDRPLAFSWPTGAGVHKGIPAIRAKISYDCWRHFLSVGRNNLAEYNSTHNEDIRIVREQTVKVSDQERLGLYIRKFIKDVHVAARRKCPEIVFKKSMLHIGREYSMTPTMAAYRFNINFDQWSGLPLEALFSPSEKESIEKGEVEKGGLRLTGVNLTKPLHGENTKEGPERKRPRCEMPEDEPGPSGIQQEKEREKENN
ncbi:unnamed protein product [Cylicocyclus nassatus]|uniref:Uncharacterized protein n=1 Tax=Cylicocyclus nassatus TaxID=53992 RepID=A0AA36GNH7_CYLNA|nr:unnamed protein product [Cylicocyclus nassatus]